MKIPVASGMSVSHVVGIVVIGRNEGARLGAALQSVLAMDVPVVYVDSRSKDDSVWIAKNLGVMALELSSDRPINASRARNEGVAFLLEKLPGLEYLHLLDGDSTLDPGWISAATEYLDSEPRVGFVCGRLREKDRDTDLLRRLCDLEWHREPSLNAECGGLGMVRTVAFQAAGGLDDSLIAGADPEFYARLKKLGWEVHSMAAPMGVHDSGMGSFRQWWTRSVKGGYAYAHARLWGGWRRERLSALVWGGALPAMTLILVLSIGWGGALLLLTYPLQIVRIRMGPSKKAFSSADRWLYAANCTAIKFPQCLGIGLFEYRRLTKQHGGLIEYKKAKAP